MGNPTGFLNYTRELPARRPVQERIKDYKEFIEFYTNQKLNQQAGRCMNCGVPFCHNGCPLGNMIPEFNEAVYQQKWKEAYAILTSTNNFPEFTGRICPAPCEAACVLGINQPAIAIEDIEKHIIEIAFAQGYVKPQIPDQRSGKKVAVVGSGPAGLAAAAQLNYAGHTVTVFEREDAPGGLLRYGIPDFKLEKWVVDRRLRIMEQEGVVFKCNVEVGTNLPVSDLINTYDAVVLAGGSDVPRDLSIPGRALKGVHFAMSFLTQQNRRIAGKEGKEENILAGQKNVIVIGGGDTGSDCVGTAIRHGAKSISQFELLPKPPENRTAHMPWPTYPMTLKTSSSHEEGSERQWAVATKEFVGDHDGNVKGIKIVDLEWKITEEGMSSKFVEIPETEREIQCELALLAMGFKHPQQELLIEQLNLTLDERGNVKASDEFYQTNIPGVFVAGDMRRGQSLVVWAINEGRECAHQVDNFLSASVIQKESNFELNRYKRI